VSAAATMHIAHCC